MKPLAIIVDRDGTTASIHNGPKHGARSDTDWTAFNAAIRFDAPVPEVVALLRSIRPGVVRIMVSGRAEGQYGKTDLRMAMLDWIYKHQIPVDVLIQRQWKDRRLDSVVKEEILVTKILPFYTPVVAIDDRPQVLEVWKKYNIATVAVTNPGTLPPIAFQLCGKIRRSWMEAESDGPACVLPKGHDGLHSGKEV